MQAKRTSRMRMAAVLAPLLLAVSSLPAEAALNSIDDINWGPNSIIRDTATNLDWLKPIKTTNLSYEFVSNQLGTGNYAAFHYASLTDVKTLFTDAGMPLGCCFDGIAYGDFFARVTSFVSLFGQTYEGPYLLNNTVHGVSGLLAPTEGKTDPQFANAQYGILFGGPGYGNGETFGTLSDAYMNPQTGSWLIRNASTPPVPEPGSFAMMLVGLAVISVAAKRRHRAV